MRTLYGPSVLGCCARTLVPAAASDAATTRVMCFMRLSGKSRWTLRSLLGGEAARGGMNCQCAFAAGPLDGLRRSWPPFVIVAARHIFARVSDHLNARIGRS